MFWDIFVGFQVPRDQLKSFDGVLVNFSVEQVEVRGYINIRTTFTNNHASSSIVIRYLAVNTPSSYNLLLRRPSLNKLGVVVSSIHLIVKFPTLEGEIVTLRVDQKIAQKCYESNIRTCCNTYFDSPPFDINTLGVNPHIIYEDKRP